VEVVEGKAFINGKIRKASIGIENGKIVAIKKILYGKTRSYRGLIFPSGIDVHVHFREPGYEYKEDFFTGSRAAAQAGVTAIFDMPNNKPAIMNSETFREKIEKIRHKAWVDYGLYAGVSKDMVKRANLFKLYLSGDNEIFVDYDELPSLFKKIKERNAILAIHAEDKDCVNRAGKNLKEYEKNSPIECEEKAVKRIIKANKDIKAKLHICHVTSKETAELLLKNKISFGVTLHHILFSHESQFKKIAMGKVNPPLRDERTRKKLFGMVMKGKIPIIESDHAPHSIEEKENFEIAPAGMPGVDALLPIMLYFVKKGMISLKNLYKMVAGEPAKLMEINKGAIAVGKDADFIVIDFKKVEKVKALSKCGWNAYEEMSAVYPIHVWMRGNEIVENGMPVGEPMGERIK